MFVSREISDPKGMLANLPPNEVKKTPEPAPLPPELVAELIEKRIQQLFRTLLMQEPRGHKDMFGIILTPPAHPKAHYGLLFIHSEGYIDMCGHSIMSATTALIETGMVSPSEPETRVVLDTPLA